MPENYDGLSKLKAFLLDMDGVLYVGKSFIDGTKEGIENLREKEKKLIFLTNNSTMTRRDYSRRLSDYGLEVDESEIMTSAYATALYLSEEYEEKSVYMIGEEGLERELENAGFEIVSKKEAQRASFVVVGMDRNLNYEKIHGALTAILSGAKYIATNPDPTFPTEEGLAPGAGACLGAVSGTSDRDPEMVIGKPSSYMVNASLDILDVTPEETAIVGDRLETDIEVGSNVGLTTILVLTGIDSRRDVERIVEEGRAPDYVMSNLAELTEWV